MNDNILECDLKEHVDNGCIIIMMNGHLSYLNSDGTICPIEKDIEQHREA